MTATPEVKAQVRRAMGRHWDACVRGALEDRTRAGIRRLVAGMKLSADDDEKANFTMEKQATYPPEFMQLVAERKFRQPSTGNMVKFVSLTPEEQQKLYGIYQRNVAAREQAAGAERERKRRRPTFGKAKEAVFGALDEAGWETRQRLKVPKAVKTIGDNQVILHFKPQAVWMEVRGRENVPARSLHDDLRDVDPAKWVESLGDVAEERVTSEEKENAPYRRASMRKEGAYSEEFMGFVGSRDFRHPRTGNDVKFESLPSDEQSRIFRKWRKLEGGRPPEGSTPVTAENFAEVEVGARMHVRDRDDGFVRTVEVTGKSPAHEHGSARMTVHDADQPADKRTVSNQMVFHPEELEEWADVHVIPQQQRAPTVAKESFERMTNQIAARVAQRRASHEEFLQAVGGRQFRNPATGNPVKFTSLPAQEQERIQREWEQQAGARGRHEEQEDPRGDTSGVGHDDERARYAEIDQEAAAMENWSFLPTDKESRMMLMPAVTTRREPGVPHMKKRPGGDDEEIEPPPPSEIKRQLADRMREMGRSLMVSGGRAPRQQMMEIGKTLDGLIDQLDMLADQPGRQALRRRILLGLRQRVLSGR